MVILKIIANKYAQKPLSGQLEIDYQKSNLVFKLRGNDEVFPHF